MNQYFSNKKTSVSFVLSLLVFFIHFRVFSVFDNADNALNNVLNAFHLFTYVAVPLFFSISAAMFYRNYTLKATWKKLRNRFFSLCVPYLLWNSFWLIIALLGNYTPLSSLFGGVKAELSLQNIIQGVFFHKFFQPFWFIHQLIVLTALCPLIYIIMKNKLVGIVSILSYFILYCSGFEFNPGFLPNTSCVIYYLIGAFIGLHCFEAFAARRKKLSSVIAIVIYLICTILIHYIRNIPQKFPEDSFIIIPTVIAGGSFWIIFDYFDYKICPHFLTYSFMIYALHSFVGAAISKIIYIVFRQNALLLPLVAVLSFSFTIFAICVFGYILDKHMPKLKRLLFGR